MNLNTIMNVEALKDVIRKAGGVVHSDGNIFFTHAMQFLRAASAATPAEWAMVPPEPDEALLRPFYNCPPAEMPIAYKAMLWIALTRRRRIEVVPGHEAPPPQTETGIQCECGDSYPGDSWGAGFIAAAGRCANCDAANGEPFESGGLLPFTATPSPDSQARNAAIREAMAAIAETESRKQALEIMEGMLKP